MLKSSIKLKTKLNHNGYSATLNHVGAELASLQNPGKTEYIWNADPQFWNKHAPVLFPIIGELKDKSFSYRGQKYHLPRHGFAREMEFALTHHSENQAVFSLHYSEETLRHYPFRFWLQINYRLMNNMLLIGYSVINDGVEKMPFSLGAHPAFALPGNFEEYAVEFEKNTSLHVSLLENNLMSAKSEDIQLKNKTLPLNYNLFENDALILKNIASKSLSILKNGKRHVSVEYDDFPHLGLWTKQEAPFLCVEPWFGYADTVEATGDLFEKESMLVLEPGGVFNTNFTIEVF
jgi:galactose mutarotase-like enzyme